MKRIFLNPYDKQSVVSITYRPIRNAFLIPKDDTDMLLQSIKINSSLWGGALNGIFPYEEIIAGEDNFWKKTFENYKADNVIIPNNASEEIVGKIAERYDLFHLQRIAECFERDRFNKIHMGSHVFSLFENEKLHLTKDTRKQLLFFKFENSEHKDDLRYAITFGSINDDRTSLIAHSYLRPDCPYDSYANILELAKTSLGTPNYIQYLSNWLEGKFSTFFDYTILSTERFSRSVKSSRGTNLLEIPMIILVKDNLMNYMLARNLHYRLLNFPIMVKIDNDVDTMKEDLMALKIIAEKNRYVQFNLFSFDCSEEEINDFIGKLGVKTEIIKTEDLLEIFEAEVDFSYRFSEQLILQKHIELLLKKPQFFDALDNHDYFIAELRFSNYQLPYKKILNEKHWNYKKIFSDGFKVLLSGNEDERLNLMLPEIDDIIYTLMVKRNIWIRDTDVRRRMKAVASYFDSFWELDMFTTKEMQNLFFKLKCNPTDVFNYGDICKIIHEGSMGERFPKELNRYLISTLVKKNILFRGALVRCSNCYITEWRMLDDIQNNNVCNGCGNKNLFSDISKTDWTYKLNRLFSENFDLTVFLTLMYLVGFKHPDLDKIIGYNFGFKADISKNAILVSNLNGKKEIEIDFSIIENGKITMGECKQNPTDFTDEIVSNVLEFGKFVECDRIVFSSLGSLDGLRNKMKKMKLVGYPEIELLDEKELIYITAYLQNRIESKRKYRTQDIGKEDLEKIPDRRRAFIEQYSMIARDRLNPNDVIGEYFHS